ncbi:helix-turn-helix domain-containing protein [Elizabethkingia meningoseptica]|uniref:helix-turn-helix domain-containing protein n=1 Tax=Elizabethkingia meningoseptica TaxID=238 RepID=UPI0023AEFEA9|nr:AraC family transcriptional regulator [Elizabethkingia meningoseptica]MDE5430702.1 AraC family transcriptional regulator [Elizabethkingia meningoseptica]
MTNQKLRNNEIIKLKHKIMKHYVLTMSIALITLALLLYVYDINDLRVFYTMYYLLSGAFLLFFGYLILNNKLSISVLVNIYFILAPIYNIYVLVIFWNLSVVGFVWLLPLPLGAYIFFSMKEVWFYSIYIILTIIITIFIVYSFKIDFIEFSKNQIRVYDTIIIIFNIVVIGQILYYNDRILKHETIGKIEVKQKFNLPITLEENEANYYNSLFEKIDLKVSQSELFRNKDLNISLLSSILKTNNNYISKAIRLKGYSNFNNYVNTLRIEYVKKAIQEYDLEKVTLMYIYIDAGFINQSTFNRVFKKIEGITPSDYIKNINNTKI